MRIRPQAACHPERPHYCKGLCKPCYIRPRQEAIRKKNKAEGKVYPSQTPEAKRKGHLKLLGWTQEMFDKVWEEQHGKCAICKKHLNLDLKQNEARACADHEHIDPPRPRGILCTNCNAMIGQAQENSKTLRSGAEYLEKFSLELPAEVVKITE